MRENVMEYQRKEYRTIHAFETLSHDFFNINNWYYPKEDISLTGSGNGIQIKSMSERAKYLSLFENNTNFSIISKEELKLRLGKENTIKISGAKSETMDLIIYLLEYDSDCNQVNKSRIHLNRLTSFIVSPNAVYCRIAIRLTGQGTLEISNVFTSESIPKAAKSKKSKIKKNLEQIKVAALIDDEYLQTMADIVTVIPIDKEQEAIPEVTPDLLLVGSSMSSGKPLIGPMENETFQMLKRMILWCKKNNIPIVFWDVDGPANIEDIREIFPLIDFVFTVDEALIPVYQQFAEHNNIYWLPAAVDSRIYNPMNINKGLINQFFNEKLAISKKMIPFGSMDKRIGKLSKLGVEVIRTEENLAKAGKIDHIKNCTLLINQESKSHSIIPESIIKMLASGIPVINMNSHILNRILPGIVQSAWNEKDIIDYINMLSTNPQNYREISSKSAREIFRNHTYQNRIQYILNCVSIPFELPSLEITVVFIAHSKEVFYKMMEKINNQSYQHMKVIVLISVFDGFEEIYNQYNHDGVYVYLEKYVYEKYRIADLVSTKYVTVLNPNKYYSEYYIEDHIHAFGYSQAACVGQANSNNYQYHETEFEYIEQIEGTAFFEAEAIQEGSFYDLIYNQAELFDKYISQDDRRIFCNGRVL